MTQQLTLFSRNKSWEELQPLLNRLQGMVYLCIADHPEGISDRDIATLTGLELATVCGRRHALAYPSQLWDMPLIEQAEGKRSPKTGKYVSTWRVKING